MTAAQQAKLKKALLALKTELESGGFQKLEPNRTSEAEVGDNEDEQPLNEMMQSVASGRNRAHAGMLVQVTRALAKLRDDPDDYGVCEDCSEDISAKRLEAMPYAQLCVVCQSKKDDPRGYKRKSLTDYK
jgi:DnaK suppressor protein